MKSGKKQTRAMPLKIAGIEIRPGERKCIELPAASLYTQTPMNLPVHVIRGKLRSDPSLPSPCLFITAAIHGDELNGVEIIRRLLVSSRLKHLHGTLIVVPVVNVYGFISLSRYLPDRRDLNRSFPGSQRGSLASRLANLLMKEIISKCEYGIDLHTGAIHRPNLPQIRVNLDTKGAETLAKAFNVPVILDSKLRDGSLREAASELGIPILVFEGGEALRLDELSVRVGVRGILRVMENIGMLHTSPSKRIKSIVPLIARSSHWVRAPKSGIIHPSKALGDRVREGERLGFIVDPFGSPDTDARGTHREDPIVAERDGIIIGRNNLPLVNEGDALFHIACYEEVEVVESQLEELQELELRPPDLILRPDKPDSGLF
ncbi:MAG: succinylglutamate desuccinylase/aspartoacylase family protein [Methanosarcinaceae archaeon]|nr:succinylglutamate desuccinylase/aspartoacylase family protein [Methanosarcinaceae archaeon]